MQLSSSSWGLVLLGSLGLLHCGGTTRELPNSKGDEHAGEASDTDVDRGSSLGGPMSGSAGKSSSASSAGAGGRSEAGESGGASTPKPPESAAGAGGVGAGGAEPTAAEGGAGGAGGAEACSDDLESDALNCGSCGHDCLGGECHAGRCAPLVLAEGQFRVQSLALDEDYVYWANFPGAQNVVGQGRIQRTTLAGGGTPAVLADQLVNPAGLIVTAASIYFTNVYCCSGDISKLAKSGGTPLALATNQAGPQGSVLFDGTLYWPTHVQSGQVGAVSVNGGPVTPLYTGLDRPQWVAVNSSDVYWAELEAGNIRRAPRAGGTTPTPLVTGEVEPVLLTLTPTYLFWRANSRMRRMSLGGGRPLDYYPNEATPSGMLSDGKNIVWISDDGIKAAPFEAGSVQTLVSAEMMGGAGALAVDAKSVVWTDSVSGRILRLAR